MTKPPRFPCNSFNKQVGEQEGEPHASFPAVLPKRTRAEVWGQKVGLGWAACQHINAGCVTAMLGPGLRQNIAP